MERRLLRLPGVQRLTTLGRTRIYELVAEQRFPQPVRLGPRRVAWLAELTPSEHTQLIERLRDA